MNFMKEGYLEELLGVEHKDGSGKSCVGVDCCCSVEVEGLGGGED
jgi:hypothetical protein